jgi:hypothetical protein
LNYYGSIRSETGVTPRDENRCVMRLVCELREICWLMGFIRNWLECYLGVYSRNLWSSIQIWLKISPVSNKKVLLTFDWSAPVRACRGRYFGALDSIWPDGRSRLVREQ